jgi:hypothetical protein
MVSARSIPLLFLSAVVTCAQVCPNATTSDTSYFAFTVHLLYGTNTTCTGEEEIAVRDTINDALTNMNITQSGGPRQEISGDICTDDGDSINDDITNRKLVVIKKWTWNGRLSKCKNCCVTRFLSRNLTSFPFQRAACAPPTQSSECVEDSKYQVPRKKPPIWLL